MELVRFGFVAFFMIAGIVCMAAGVYGMFRFHYVLNRMHMAATVDTFGILLVMIGLMIWKGFGAEMLKMLLIVVFFWISGPVSSHLISRMEVSTNDDLSEECEVKEYGNL